MQPSIPMGGVSPAPTMQRASLWPEVTTGNGERPRPTWRPLSHPVLALDGIGHLLGTVERGRPHLERIAAWAEAAVAQGKPLVLADTALVMEAYLHSRERIRDHKAWLQASLQAVHILPRAEDVMVKMDPARIASMVAKAHDGWVKAAPRNLAKVLAEAQAGRAA